MGPYERVLAVVGVMDFPGVDSTNYGNATGRDVGCHTFACF